MHYVTHKDSTMEDKNNTKYEGLIPLAFEIPKDKRKELWKKIQEVGVNRVIAESGLSPSTLYNFKHGGNCAKSTYDAIMDVIENEKTQTDGGERS